MSSTSSATPTDPPLNPDLLYAPGSITFFFDPRTGQVDHAAFPARHADMLNEDNCKLGRQYLRTDQHDFDGVPLLRTKVTYYGIVAGRFGQRDGKPVICIWNRLNDEEARQVVHALVEKLPGVSADLARTFVVTDGYHDSSTWRLLTEWI